MQTVFVFSMFEVKNRRLLHERGQFMTFYIHVPVYQPNQDLSYDFLFKDICGYFQCAPFPCLQTGKVVWVLSFDP